MNDQSNRYYVSASDDGQRWLTKLGAGQPAESYPLPELPPGLDAQLSEWQRWRDTLKRAMRSAPTDPPHWIVFADMLGEALQAEPDTGAEQ